MLLCWTVHRNGGPEKGYDHAAVAAGHKVYSFGNYGSEPHIAVHIFNTVSLRWTKLCLATTGGEGERHPLAVPSRRQSHTAVLIENIVYIWGGKNFDTGEYCRTLYAFDVDAHGWSAPAVSGSVPEARAGHSACVLGKVVYVFGGYVDQRNGCSNHVYRLDTAAMVWASVNAGTPAPPPPASQCHSATIIGTRMFVFGGQGDWDEDHYDSVRVFDTETNRWLSTPSSSQPRPERRACHSAFAHNGELFIIGGDNLKQIFHDVWKFTPHTFSWKEVEPKGRVPCLWETGICCCVVGARVVLFGGYRTTISLDDLVRERDTETSYLSVFDLSPSLKTLCQLTVILRDLEQSGLPRDLRWELAAMAT